MKNKKHLTIILLSLFIISCGKNELELTQQNEKYKIENKYGYSENQPPSKGTVTETVKRIIAENIGVAESDITLTTNLVNDLGADELNLIEIIIGIENEFDVEFSDEQVEKLLTVEDYINIAYSTLHTVTFNGAGGGDPYIPPYINPGQPTPSGGTVPPGGAYTGGGSSGSTNPSKDIRNKTEDPCISANVNALLKNNNSIDGKMAEIIKKFDQSKSLNINIYDGETSNGKSGEMFKTIMDGSNFTAEIRLQTSYFKGQNGASKESLAAVLIHEVLHGFIKKQSPSLLLLSHHNEIAQNYIAPMSDYLVSTFGISRRDAFSLAWNGVIDSDVFNNADANYLFNYSYIEDGVSKTISVSKQEIQNRAGAYNGNTNYDEEGKKGIKAC